MKRKMVVIPAVAFAMYALSHQPTQSADAVSRGWNSLTAGSGSVMNGFFTFVGRL